ncbi:adenylate kinase [Campylobacter upsaliensis]|nr:adenylate kinase [Campylobacter upsaliensis]EAI6710245.1 adenylate kinase [Campylobacter upsaliensis]EAJ1956677.1 adenylate kinase [Campylobacter upsaliensis]EAJ3604864.1 adenylate kinase [Campylobacter upsaliensis]EAK4449007.1 adenylate kinase [Campylobacter upsaliensis]
MIILIGGESHTGKTLLAQRLLEIYHYPYMSLDHLKMGFIKGLENPPFSVEEDSKITAFLWRIVVGIIETCIENEQNLILEGINLTPKNVRNLLDSKPFAPIKVLFLIFSKHYILKHYHTIKLKENTIEKRKESYVASKEQLIKEHSALKEQCKKYKLPFIEIQEDYESEMQGVVVV